MSMVLTLFGRADCHLCEEMRRDVEKWRNRGGFSLEVVDVDSDPVLARRYGHKVPVLVDGEQEICHYFLDEVELCAHLGLELDESADASSGDAGHALREASVYERIYALVEKIPTGRVATYGQIAAIEGHCTPRMVGYAMSAIPAGRAIPWQRVINAQGTISERSGGGGTSRQRRLLEREGVAFDRAGRVSFDVVGWSGPDWEWLDTHGYFAAAPPGARSRSGPSPG